jgi:hypothetical protein
MVHGRSLLPRTISGQYLDRNVLESVEHGYGRRDEPNVVDVHIAAAAT